MNYEKIKNFLNDEENHLVVRFGMVLFGIISGCSFVLLSLLFERGTVGAVTFLVFGCIMFACFLIAPAVWWGND